MEPVGSIVIILNAGVVALLVAMLSKAFSVARAVGKYEADFAAFKDNAEGEILRLRQNVHRISNQLAGLAAVSELRAIRKRDSGDSGDGE
jgi:hypothetical protein